MDDVKLANALLSIQGISWYMDLRKCQLIGKLKPVSVKAGFAPSGLVPAAKLYGYWNLAYIMQDLCDHQTETYIVIDTEYFITILNDNSAISVSRKYLEWMLEHVFEISLSDSDNDAGPYAIRLISEFFHPSSIDKMRDCFSFSCSGVSDLISTAIDRYADVCIPLNTRRMVVPVNIQYHEYEIYNAILAINSECPGCTQIGIDTDNATILAKPTDYFDGESVYAVINDKRQELLQKKIHGLSYRAFTDMKELLETPAFSIIPARHNISRGSIQYRLYKAVFDTLFSDTQV